jgi:hypothetical protein
MVKSVAIAKGSSRCRLLVAQPIARDPSSAVRMSEGFPSKIEAAGRPVRAAFGETQAKLPLD